MRRTLPLLTLVALAAGCVAIPSGPGPIGQWPPAAGKPRSVSIVLNSHSVVNGDDLDTGKPLYAIWQNSTLRAYRESGLFSSAQLGLAPSDVRAVIDIERSSDFSRALSYLVGATFCLVPMSERQHYTLRTRLTDQAGTVLGEFEEQGNIVIWTQLFLVFGMPFATAEGVTDDLVYDLSAATLARARTSGVLD